jgi:prepilin-type N-terminal cleavage/methylation domain-containing protein
MIHSVYNILRCSLARQASVVRRDAFTLIEMMVAMAVTLLLMAALGRGFAFIGETIRDSRAQVELTNELRDITNRLQTDLASCTVSLQPCLTPNEPAGYFMYSEGPLTDATSSLFLSEIVDGSVETPHSRYGDYDDYIAFTAVAAGDNWFTGKVPRFVLDQKTAQFNNVAYNPTNFGGNPWDPVVIQSKYAEIVYFASPDYVREQLPTGINPIDFDGNSLPDNIRLHRRVLLIRPDLNVNGAITNRDFTINGVSYPFMRADQWPSITAGTNETVTAAAAPIWGDAWIYGMAGVHQQCDLSLRRVLDANGLPTRAVAANSLSDLSLPHNRFGHVRVPPTVAGLPNDETTMPILALGPPPPVLNSVSAVDGVRLAPPISGVNASVVITPNLMSGFIRPEFVLGNNFTHRFSPEDAWGLERSGEDVIATNALALDVKIFDRNAAMLTTLRGQTVRASDPGYREALRDFSNRPTPRPIQVRGDFVDLMFPVLAGGPVRGWQARRFDRLAPDTPPSDGPIVFDDDMISLLVTEFSGLFNYNGTLTTLTAYQESLYRSGKIVVDANGYIRIFQPTFDTSTFHYEHDGFLQGLPAGSGKGTRWSMVAPINNNYDLGASGINSATSNFAADNFFEREASPPFLTRPESIQISVRVENPTNRQVHQMSVVHRDRQ